MKQRNNTKRPKRPAAIEDLERLADGNFRARSLGPCPSRRKPHGQRRALTVPADEAAIRALKPDGTRQQIKVVGIPHLDVRVEPNGTRAYYIRCPHKGGRAHRKIGDVNETTLREAKLGCQIAVLKWRVAELEAELRATRGKPDA